MTQVLCVHLGVFLKQIQEFPEGHIISIVSKFFFYVKLTQNKDSRTSLDIMVPLCSP